MSLHSGGAGDGAAAHNGQLLPETFGVVDLHCHVPDVDFVPKQFREATVRTMARNLELRGSPIDPQALQRLVEATFNDPQCDRLVSHMDDAGVALAVLVVPDFTYRLQADLTIEDLLLRASEIMQRHPGRLSGLAGVDPRWGNDGVALFEKAVDNLGFRGLKIYPPCGIPPSDRSLYPFYEVCASRSVPVMVHTGGSASCLDVELARPLGVDKAARDFPNVNFVLAHGCANLLDETITLCTFRPNVFVDMSALPAGGHRALEEAAHRGIAHRLLYGSDWPVFQAQGGFSAQLSRLLAIDGPLASLSAWQLRRSFGDTARELLALGQDDETEPQFPNLATGVGNA